MPSKIRVATLQIYPIVCLCEWCGIPVSLGYMKVCVLTTTFDVFKGGNHLPLFSACTHTEFTILTNRSKPANPELPSNITIETLEARIGPYYYGCADYLYAKAVLKRYPPHHEFWKQFDVIHCNQVMGPALKKLKKTGVPVVVLIHHPVTADREVAVAESGFFDALQWRAKYFLLVHWQKKFCKAAQHIATVSQTMRDRIACDYSVHPEKISVVPNGVDGAVFSRKRDSECSYDVVAVGSFIHPRKGFRYLLEVYKKLAAAGMKIADVGRRSEEQMQQLRSINGVIVHGMVDSFTLIDLVQGSRVLISTSLFEGFGLSLIEALACGHPCMAFSVGAVPEVVGSIEPTLVVPPRDTEALAQAVQAYLQCSSEQRDEQGKHYREEVLRRYALHSSAEALEGLYEGMIS